MWWLCATTTAAELCCIASHAAACMCMISCIAHVSVLAKAVVRECEFQLARLVGCLRKVLLYVNMVFTHAIDNVCWYCFSSEVSLLLHLCGVRVPTLKSAQAIIAL